MIDIRRFTKGSTWLLNSAVTSGTHVVPAGTEVHLPYPRRGSGTIGIKIIGREEGRLRARRKRFKDADLFVDASQLHDATLLDAGEVAHEYYVENEEGLLWWGTNETQPTRFWSERDFNGALHHTNLVGAEQNIIRINFRQYSKRPMPVVRIVVVDLDGTVVETITPHPEWLTTIDLMAKLSGPSKMKGRRMTAFRGLANRIKSDDLHPYRAVVEVIPTPVAGAFASSARGAQVLKNQIPKLLKELGVERYHIEGNMVLLSREDMTMFTLGMSWGYRVYHLL
jgi:hypothetical protein